MYSGVLPAAEAALLSDSLAEVVGSTGRSALVAVGALRDQLAVVAAAGAAGCVHSRVVFLGGGPVAAAELRGLLQLGARRQLPRGSRWTLIVANIPHVRHPGRSIVTQAAAEACATVEGGADAAMGAAWACSVEAGADGGGGGGGSGGDVGTAAAAAAALPVYTFTSRER